MSIIVLGTVALDNVKTPAGTRSKILGGSASHFAMSARLFTDVNLVADIGEDFPEKHLEFLKGKGLNLDSLRARKGKTFEWDGEYKGDMNTALTLNTELGVLASFKPVIEEYQKDVKYVFLANVDPTIQRHLLKDIRSPKLIGLDSMNYWISSTRESLLETLKMVDIYVANDAEARDLSGEVNLIKAAKHLSSLGPKMIVIKKGEHGSLFYSDKFIFSLPAYPIETVVDPTGAGDTFAGGFMGYLARAEKLDEKTIRRAVAYGTVLASFNVEDFGVDRVSGISMAKVDERLEKFKKMIEI